MSGEGLNIFDAMEKMCYVRSVSLGVKRELYEGVLAPAKTQRSETSGMRKQGDSTSICWN